MKYYCHKFSDVQSENIGEKTTIWQFVVILPGAIIGSNCNINSHVFIENDVTIGNNVTVKSGVQIWDGIILEDNVFIGPNVTFTNDIVPRSKKHIKPFQKTIIKRGASIGANVTILGGNIVEEFAFVGAGSVVTKCVGKNELWVGNPAKHVGFVTNSGDVLDLSFFDKRSNIKHKWNNKELEKEND